MKQENASAVEKSSLQTNTQKQRPVQDNAGATFATIKSIKRIGFQSVYNMEVDGNHNFAVNGGLIVHNCMDATRYFVKTKKIVRPKSEYHPLWN